MDDRWNEAPRPEDWARAAGDSEEIGKVADALGIAVTSADDALVTASAIIDDLAENPVQDDSWDERFNLAGMYLWIAASLGSRRAGFRLADHIRDMVKGSVLKEVNAAWFMEAADKWEARCEGRTPLPLGLLGRKGRRLDGDGKEDGCAEPEFAESREEGVVVVPAVGDPKSPEGSSIAKRYAGVVGRALPFRSRMPAPGEAYRAIASEWPWAEHVGRHVDGMLDVQRSVLVGRPVLRPMLFVGPPGSGKTALASRVAELMGVPALVIPAGGAADAAGLSAVTRGWSSSRPCGPVMAMTSHGCCDPAVIVDELDKTAAPGAKNGSAAGVLLGMLGNPESFHDACLLAEVNLSRVFFMATANDLGGIPDALRDRFSVHVVGRPGVGHFDTVLGALRRRRAAELGVRKEMLPDLDADEYGALRDHFSRGGCSLRELSRAYDFVLSQAVQRVAAERVMAN